MVKPEVKCLHESRKEMRIERKLRKRKRELKLTLMEQADLLRNLLLLSAELS